MPEYEEYIEEIKDIWDSHWLTNMGAKHNELEKELEKYLKVDQDRKSTRLNSSHKVQSRMPSSA